MYKYAEIISLVLTFITLQMCFEVLFTWKNEALKFIKGGREPWVWAGIAIFLHFFVSFIDNTYWGIAWSHHLVGSERAELWFKNGVFSNIPFRQIGTSVAAFCYLRAGYLFHKKHMDQVYSRMLISFSFGIAYVLFIMA